MVPLTNLGRLLRTLGAFLTVVLVAGGTGTALGVGIAELTNDQDPAGARATAAPTTTAVARPARTSSASPPAAQDRRPQVEVTVTSVVLHGAATPSGKRRRRARLGVRVKVQNHGAERIVAARPSLLAARQRISTDPRADSPQTRLGALGPGESADVTLRFETTGAVTRQLTTQKRARILVAGRSRPIRVTVGTPVSS